MSARSICTVMLLAAAALPFSAQTAKPTHAPKPKVITVRVLDGRTGEHIVPNNVLVRVDRRTETNIEWVKLADDGTATLMLPAATTSFAVHATYENGTEFYVNCDVSKQRLMEQDTWYPVDGVLTEGLVMPNECDRAKNARDVKIEAKPGEFVMLVRKHTWRDRVEEIR
jgi:hypothetical protein